MSIGTYRSDRSAASAAVPAIPEVGSSDRATAAAAQTCRPYRVCISLTRLCATGHRYMR